MRKLVLMAGMMLVVAQAEATSLHPETFTASARLDLHDVDTEQFPQDILSARVEVNNVNLKVARLIVELAGCPASAEVCIQIVRQLKIELPIVSVSHGTCGETVVLAKLDRRLVDGGLQELEIIDYSTMTCKMVRPIRPTVVTYTTESSGFGSPVEIRQSRFYGEGLSSLISTPPTDPRN